MTEQIYAEVARKIMQNKNQIEKALKVKLSAKGNIVLIEGNSADELIALNVIEAINLGFSVVQALDLKNEDFIFEKISIKNLTKRKDLSQIRARIIGTERSVLRNVEMLTNCDIVLHENMAGIIGRIEDVKKASYAIRKIISGSKYATIYRYLEEQKAIERETF